MNKSGKGTRESISGKDISVVSGGILQKVIRLVRGAQGKFVEIRKSSSMDSVRITVAEIIEMMDALIAELEEIGKQGVDYTPNEEEINEYEMLDHLIKEEEVLDPNDLKSVLLEVIKVNRNIQAVVSLLASEYQNSQMSTMLSHVSDNMIMYKNRVEGL
ncbi:MAG: hypothetical protein M1162_01520, partial [Candidatus Thermoplasmatota archaeon]|nr:hypothetical protein [Candidatus Thermoplasmatota archaeon]